MVGVFHQDGAADARLQVLERQALQGLAEARLELLRIDRHQVGDGVGEQLHAQVPAQGHRVVHRAAR
ncbi:hypothetical protein D3C72_2292660 [compost metagenome]